VDELDLRVAAIIIAEDQRIRRGSASCSNSIASMSVGDTSVRTGISGSAVSATASDANVDSRDRSRTRTRTAARNSARDDNDDAACHITNIVQMNRSRRMQNRAGGSRGHGYGHGHGQGSSKSLSGKSVTSIKSQREVRNAEIARTVIRQARGNSSTIR